MTPAPYTEDTLVQQTSADCLEQQLGWEYIYAHKPRTPARIACWAAPPALRRLRHGESVQRHKITAQRLPAF